MSDSTLSSPLLQSALFSLLLAAFVGPANSWDLGSIVQQNLAFDQQFNNQLAGMMANNYARQQQLLQSYIQSRGPQLQQDYQQYQSSTGIQLPFEQFAYYHMLTAGGTNPAPALQQQRRSFEVLQDANRGLQQGYDRYNQGWWANSRNTDRTLERYGNEAVMGNAWYGDPQTGEIHNLPYTSGPGFYTGPDGTYYQGPAGDYYQVDPLGYGHPLEYMGAPDE